MKVSFINLIIELKQIPTFYFNSISTTLKEDHEGFIDFKVIELVLIICSILISLLSGSPYFMYFITLFSQNINYLSMRDLWLNIKFGNYYHHSSTYFHFMFS